jgi:hypothetical protein
MSLSLKKFAGFERYAVIGEHFYQPPRKGSHQSLKNIQTDLSGKDWNTLIAQQCYLPQLNKGTLEHASFDFYTTMRRELQSLSPKEAQLLREAMKLRGVGDPFLHVLLPDLNKRDKHILIQAGYSEFQKETNVAPKWFWAPESALDNETLEVLSAVGYQGVLCAPEQIEGTNGEADNRPINLKLHNNTSLIALPFDRPFSGKLAFGEKYNADTFTREVIMPRILILPKSVPLVGWTDGETFGHYDPFADLFLNYLLTESMPNVGVAILGINETTQVWENKDFQQGKLKERTAWSCPHGNLIRWHGACPCDRGHNGEWKKYFYQAVTNLNKQVDKILDQEIGNGWPEKLANNFSKYFYFSGSKNSKDSLLAAKASALAAMTSCGTFFESPGTSGNINILFAQQVIENLKDAGFVALAQKIQKEMISTLTKGRDPFTKKNLAQFFKNFIH